MSEPQANEPPVTASPGPVVDAFAGRTIFWALSHGDWAERFDQVLVMRRGRVVEQGNYEELNKDGSVLHEMIAAE